MLHHSQANTKPLSGSDKYFFAGLFPLGIEKFCGRAVAVVCSIRRSALERDSRVRDALSALGAVYADRGVSVR